MKPEEFGQDERDAARRTALRIVQEVWQSSAEEASAVFGTTSTDIATWREDPRSAPVTDEQLWRISYVLGIHAALTTLVPDQSQHAGFIHRGAPSLDGTTPIEVMTQGLEGLRCVRRWLDAECQW